jgi:hypothetical protein
MWPGIRQITCTRSNKLGSVRYRKELPKAVEGPPAEGKFHASEVVGDAHTILDREQSALRRQLDDCLLLALLETEVPRQDDRDGGIPDSRSNILRCNIERTINWHVHWI